MPTLLEQKITRGLPAAWTKCHYSGKCLEEIQIDEGIPQDTVSPAGGHRPRCPRIADPGAGWLLRDKVPSSRPTPCREVTAQISVSLIGVPLWLDGHSDVRNGHPGRDKSCGEQTALFLATLCLTLADEFLLPFFYPQTASAPAPQGPPRIWHRHLLDF